MATISFTVPDTLAQELDQVARGRGHDNVKALLRDVLGQLIRESRYQAAIAATMQQADSDAAAIT